MPRKPIITAALAASMATSANAATDRSAEKLDDGDIVAVETIADDILIHDATDIDLSDLIDPWNPPHLENSDPEIEIYLAQTIYGGGASDGITSPGDIPLNRGGKLKKPSQGITLDNGIKKPGKLRTQGQTGNNLRKGKKLKKLKK